jgi:hypothetical protein
LAAIWSWRNAQKESGIWPVGLLMAGAILAKLPQLMLFPVALLLGFWPLNPKRMTQLVGYSMIVLVPPMVYYLWVHFNVTSASQFVSGILTGQVADTGNLNWKLLIKNVRRGFTDSILLLSGAGLGRLLFFRSPVRRALVVWGAIAVLYIGVVCARIPLDYYLVPVLPLAALLAAYALDGIKDLPLTVLIILLLLLVNRGSYTYLTPKYQWNQAYLSQADWLKDYTSASSVLVLSDPAPMTFYYARRVGFRLANVSDEANPFKVLQQFPGDYFIQLPNSAHQELFWKKVRNCYPEVGPGIFDLKNPKLSEFVPLKLRIEPSEKITANLLLRRGRREIHGE